VGPDFRVAVKDGTKTVEGATKENVLFIHRELKDGEVYFISNQQNEGVDLSAQFRVTGKKPELWDPVTGSIRDLPSFVQKAGASFMPIHLAANGSAFVVFRKDGTRGDTSRSNYPAAAKTFAIRKPWTVVFDTKMGGPANPLRFDSLTDWSRHSNDSVKYYSGAARYLNTFRIEKIEKGVNYMIDLGVAKDIAKIAVNGIEVGGTWTPPYQLDITRALKPGENSLEIRVVNTWVNRLLGDALLPANQRRTSALFGPNPAGGLESSGLLGPVKISIFKY